MSFKKIFMYFSLTLLLTGCASSYTYDSNNNDNINSNTTTEELNTNLSSNNKSNFFDYANIKDATANSYYGKLHVNGTLLSDKNNNPVQLKGISTHGISWFPQYINKDTFKSFRDDWNMNVIRLAMYSDDNNGYSSSDENEKNNLKSLIYKGIDAAKDLNMYVIVDWHILNDNNPLTNIDEAIDFFNEVSKKYGNDPHILYEICNEPSGSTSWEDIKLYSDEVIPVIRNNAPDSIIIVGTPNSSQDVDIASKSPIKNYDNIMYSLHFYADSHKDELRNKMNIAIKNGLPIFVTEYGICDASGNGSINVYEANKWIDTLNKNKISYVAWNLSNKNESSAILNHLTEKTSNFSSSDLSPSGEWLKYMLTKNYNSKDKNHTYVEESENDSESEKTNDKLVSEDSNKNETFNENDSYNSTNSTNKVENNSTNINSSTGNNYSNSSTNNQVVNNNSFNSSSNSSTSGNSNSSSSSNSNSNPSNNSNNNNSSNSSNNNPSNNNSSNNDTNSSINNTFEKDLIKTISTNSSLSATFNVDSSWEESGKMCYLYRITLTNTTSNIINDWSVNITLKNDIELRSFWNSSATSSNNIITLNSLHYNKTINPNSSIQDIGFIIKSK